MDIINKAKIVHKLLGRNHKRDVYINALRTELIDDEHVELPVPCLYYKNTNLELKSTIDFIINNIAIKVVIVRNKKSLLSNSELFKNELMNISSRNNNIKQGYLIIFFHSTYDEDIDPEECFTQVIIVDV